MIVPARIKKKICVFGTAILNIPFVVLFRYSQRVKFVLVPWCGEAVGVMKRARLSIQISEVKNVVRSYHIEVPASHVHDLDEADILTRLRKAGGANYDRQTSAY